MRSFSTLTGIVALLGYVGLTSCVTAPPQPLVYEVTITDVGEHQAEQGLPSEGPLLEQVIAENQKAWPWHEYIFPRAMMDKDMIAWAEARGHEPIRDKKYADGISGFDPPLTEQESDDMHHLPSKTNMSDYVPPGIKIGKQVNMPGITDAPQYNNKALLISFGGSWCSPCLGELDFLQDWYINELPKKTELSGSFEVIAIALDANVENAKQTYQVLPFPVGYAAETSIRWNDYITGNSLPTNIILDKQRRLVYVTWLIVDTVESERRIPKEVFSHEGIHGFEYFNPRVYRSMTAAAQAP